MGYESIACGPYESSNWGLRNGSMNHILPFHYEGLVGGDRRKRINSRVWSELIKFGLG